MAGNLHEWYSYSYISGKFAQVKGEGKETEG